MEDQFSYDEVVDDERDIKRKNENETTSCRTNYD